MPLKPKNILVVDDAPFIIERMLEMLHDIPGVGHILSAGNYEEAMGIFPVSTVHILLADIHLPGRNGIELLKEVRNTYPLVKVIMVSNMTSSYYLKACSDAGAEQLIDKSKAFDLLPEVLKKYL
jgi:two-component system, NarL family, invasion response regulator UvrY